MPGASRPRWRATSPRRAPLPNASKPALSHGALAERFARDLGALIDLSTDRLLVAVSGGADSLALLLLTRWALGDRCFAATVDHGLRPAAAAEAAFVAELCRRHGIAHRVLREPLPDRAGRTANVSARARALRYRLLEGERARIGAAAIATAHHVDDQIETMVMRLNRGAGVSGLAGIRVGGGHIVRPLLRWRRDELAAIVAACGIEAVDDPSNRDDRYDRARLRKALAGAGWIDPDGWGWSARALADAEDALAFAAETLFAQRSEQGPDHVDFDPDSLPFELRRRLTLAAMRRLDPAADPRGSALAKLVETLDSKRTATLGGIRAEARNGADGRIRWRFAKAPPRRSH
jgi:tRNA(Ile)-lysidine synthase